MDKVVEIDILVLKIFSFVKTNDLISCSKVNHRWRRVSEDKTLWHTIDLTLCSGSLRSLGKLITEHPQVRSLILKQSTITDPPYWQHHLSRNEVQKINLSEAYISFLGFEKILKYSPGLNVLDIRGCNFMSNCLERISYCSRHQKFMLGRRARLPVPKTPHSVISVVCGICKELREVDLGDIGEPNVLEWPFKANGTLQRLRFHCSGVLLHALNMAIQKFPKLTHLDVTVSRGNYAYHVGMVDDFEDNLKGRYPAISISIKVQEEYQIG